MLPTPKKFALVAATAEGATLLNAFDNCLLRAGIGNTNLLRVSSILPPGAEEIGELDIPPGSLLPTAYGACGSDLPGDLIAAAVAVGRGEEGYGVIMEYSGHCSAAEAETKVKYMVELAFVERGRRLVLCHTRSAEHRVKEMAYAFAAVPLIY